VIEALLAAVALLTLWAAYALTASWWRRFRRRHRRLVEHGPLTAAALFVAVAVLWNSMQGLPIPEWTLVAAAGVVVSGAVMVVVTLLRGWDPRRQATLTPAPPGVPEPPVVGHDVSVVSGVYFLRVRRFEDPDVVRFWKIGKGGNVVERVGHHRTISGDPLEVYGLIRTDEHDALEARIHADLRRWRRTGPGITAVELYEPNEQVQAYVDLLLARSGAR
jgi:hypothetical protein